MIKKFSGIRITGISATVPKRSVEIQSLAPLFGEKEIARIMRGTGVERSRATDKSITASDLCYMSAIDLLKGLDIPASSIDALVFVTTSPDYLAPPTSHILQDRLGIPTSAPCFDLTFGCSAMVYGLLQASMLISTQMAKRVLVLLGETPTKFLLEDDRSMRTLFGDAGSALLIESAPDAKDMAISAYSDGSGYRQIIIPNSATRVSEEPKASIMNGFEVFSFATKTVPVTLNTILDFIGATFADMDAFVFHQANKMIVDFVAKKCGIPEAKIPTSYKDFGNTGAASIPLSMVVDPKFAGLKKNRVMICGFGVGLSWGAAELDLSQTYFSPLTEI